MSKKIELKDLASWNKLLSTERTSITRHEGVKFLMELSGLTPPGLAPPSPYATEEEIEAFECITLFDLLDQDIEWAESDYDRARFEDDPPLDNVIAEKREKFEKSKFARTHALSYLRTIQDELAKGALRSPSADMHDITMISFEEWVSTYIHVVPTVANEAVTTGRKGKWYEQEKAILAELSRLGFEPLKLKKPPRNGMAGSAADIRPLMVGIKPLFPTDKVFDLAWARLKKQKKIASE